MRVLDGMLLFPFRWSYRFYNEESAFAAQMPSASKAPPVHPSARVPRALQTPAMLDFQFFNVSRITQLFELKRQAWIRSVARDPFLLHDVGHFVLVPKQQSRSASLVTVVLVLRAQLQRMEEEDERKRERETEGPTYKATRGVANREGQREGGQEAGGGNSGEEESGGLEQGDAAELEHLLGEGFGSWTQRDFHAFKRALVVHGRSDRQAIVAAMNPKPADEVGRAWPLWLCCSCVFARAPPLPTLQRAGSSAGGVLWGMLDAKVV